MPSARETNIISTTKLTLSTNMFDCKCNETMQKQNPQEILDNYAKKWGIEITSEEFARKLDEIDPLRHLRYEFNFPKMATLPYVDKSCVDPDSDCIYLCGHSLGLQPQRVRKANEAWLNDWANLGVHGHFHGVNPFADCDLPCLPAMKMLLGAKDNEVAVMNQLTSNLHFMMVSFYRPTPERFKILYEAQAFPSDDYAIQSQIRFHNYEPSEAAVTIKPRKNETYIKTEDILELLEQQGQSIALVLFSGVQYSSGQLFDIETITRAAQKHGCVVGWDLAHAVGNVPLKLHDWNVDFGVFCTYKYLNAGAGCVGGIFVHSNHFDAPFPHLDGWWGNRAASRFLMKPEIDRDGGANGFRVSNPSIHQCSILAASLEIFAEIGIEKLRKKSKLLTQYMQHLIESEKSQSSRNYKIQLLTPTDPEQRGALLSFRILDVGVKHILKKLYQCGVCLDQRGDVIRVAPVPLYNSFKDVYQFVSLLNTIEV